MRVCLGFFCCRDGLKEILQSVVNSMRTPPGKDRTMEGTQKLNVAIVGGGPGCKAIMEMIFAEKPSQLRMKLIGVASTNPEAVGYCHAKEKGIYTTDDYQDR